MSIPISEIPPIVNNQTKIDNNMTEETKEAILAAGDLASAAKRMVDELIAERDSWKSLYEESLLHQRRLEPITEGVRLIAQERREQIEKHGFDVINDPYDDYQQGELLQAALFCLCPTTFIWPEAWEDGNEKKVLAKDRIGQLKVAGALIAAEIDRLQAQEVSNGK
jgi:hypothetical protein